MRYTEHDSFGLLGETSLSERIDLDVGGRVLHILSDTSTEKLLGIEPESATKKHKLQLLLHIIKRSPPLIFIVIQLSVQLYLV